MTRGRLWRVSIPVRGRVEVMVRADSKMNAEGKVERMETEGLDLQRLNSLGYDIVDVEDAEDIEVGPFWETEEIFP